MNKISKFTSSKNLYSRILIELYKIVEIVLRESTLKIYNFNGINESSSESEANNNDIHEKNESKMLHQGN